MQTIKEQHFSLNEFNDTIPVGTEVRVKLWPRTYHVGRTISTSIFIGNQPVVFIEGIAFPVLIKSVERL